VPFQADITGLVKAGDVFRLTISVNNELTPDTIPPGRIEVTEDGRRQQKYLHDFYNYAGLHRSVRLFTTPSVSVEDITVNTSVEGVTGVVNYQTVIANFPESAKISVKLTDANGNEVATADGTKGTLRISDVKLWQPGAAYLYNFTVEVNEGGKLADSYTLAIGVRTVEVKGNQFLINGKPFYFTGFGMHEDHVTIGKAHNNALLVNDFQLLDWIGANSFRTSHYPYAEEVMEFADRHGIVVIDETPAVGLNGLFAGFFGAGPVKTFTDEFVSDRTQESHKQAIRELIARDKNHPSVVLWSIANEPESDTEEAENYF
jgi:beta-glucuronidase